MKKIIKIEGMHCPKCKARVENALNEIDNVSAKVDLEKKAATVTLKADVADNVLIEAVSELGFKVVSIEKKKSILGF